MRVISGEFRGRPLKSLSGDTTRPTTDKVKESIFNIIGPYFDGGICFDLYAGSGSLAIEAVSRGINKAYLFEKDRKAQNVIVQNIVMTKKEDNFHLMKGDCRLLLSRLVDKADLIFLDPPYAKQTIADDLKKIVDLQLYHDDTVVVCETDKQVILPDRIAVFQKKKDVTYGITTITIYEVYHD